MSDSLQLALGVELPAEILTRVRQLSPRIEGWTAAELERDPASSPGTPPRRSIELRSLVFWDEPRDGATNSGAAS